jgi:hypothetical protein
MAAPLIPSSRPGRLRALAIGESTTETRTTDNLDRVTAIKSALHHSWSAPCTREAGQFTRRASATVQGNQIVVTLTVTRTA